MKKTFLLSLLLGAIAFCANFTGPFNIEAGSFYFIHNGGPLKITLTFTPNPKNPQIQRQNRECGAYNIRFMDINEESVHWEYKPLPNNSEGALVSYDYGNKAPAGIYQVRFTTTTALVDVKTEPETTFGILSSRCKIFGTHANQYKNFFFYVPENANTLGVNTYGGPTVKITAPDGGKIIDTAAVNKEGKRLDGGKSVDITPYKGQILKGVLDKFGSGYFANVGFTGMSVIMCPDKETAEAIHGSVDKAQDGNYYPHKFQLKMVEWIENSKNTSLKMETIPLLQFIPEMEKDPNAIGLVGPWGLFTHINSIIDQQNIDVKSADYGKTPYLHALAAMYGMNKPYNPYYNSDILEKRILLAAFNDMLKLRENGTFDESDSNYCGGDGLTFVRHTHPYHFCFKHIRDNKGAELWDKAMRLQPERWAFTRVSCENQSSHWVFILQCMYEITGCNEYKTMAEKYAYGMSRAGGDHFMQTGYQQEAYGADGTYQGLGACYQAAYYRMSHNPVQKETLRIIYDLYNHTAAPEPDGKIFACSSYGHRTKGGWSCCQYGGGLSLMAGELPEAAVWRQPHAGEKEKTLKELFTKEEIANPGNGAKYCTSLFSAYFQQYVYPTKPLQNVKFPMETGEQFIKNFNNEFAAIRSKNCYTFTYLKGSAGEWVKYRFAKTVAPAPSSSTWATIPGLQLLWFQDFGNVLVSTNYNGDTPFTLRADTKDGKCAYTNYWQNESSVNDAGIIRNSFEMLNLEGVNIRRTMKHLDNGISMRLAVFFTKDVDVKDMFEQLPLLDYKRKVELFVNGAWTTQPGKTDQIRINEQVIIKLSSPYYCDFGPRQENQGVPIRALRIHFGGKFTTKDKIKVTYTITK